ncbi:MAG: hypothetical protein WC360_04465 [Opitutales bacterium]|jgi:hypothetical protein
MKKLLATLFDDFFTSWWKHVALLILSLSACLLLEIEIEGSYPKTPDYLLILSDVSCYLSLAAFVGILATIVVNLAKRRFRMALYAFMAIFITTIAALSFLARQSLDPPPDHFAAKLSIPANIDISEPTSTDALPVQPASGDRIELAKGIQGGIYKSTVIANPHEPGRVYLKAYELTTNCHLSAKSIRKRTEMPIGWSDDPSKLFESHADFTVYEGDWGEYYAARFEVWFVPDSGTKERLLAERIFRIEGWQR